METLESIIDIQCVLKDQLLDALHFDMLSEVKHHTPHERSSLFEAKSIQEGNCIKIERNTLPDLYRICQEVIKALDFQEPIDFYLMGNPEINAHSFEAELEGEPNLIQINSGLFNLLTEEELKFVIGHEIGHLINHDMLVNGLIQFAYPDEDTIPTYIGVRQGLYNHVSELAADRYGYLANHNLEASISALYKLASGIDLQKMAVSIPALIEENEQHVKFFMEENGEIYGDHPAQPFRVLALHKFSTAASQEELNQCIYDICHCLSDKYFDDFCVRFAYSAGMLMAKADGDVSKREMEMILERMGHDTLFPDSCIEDLEGEDLNAMLDDSIQQTLDHYGPNAAERMLHYVLKVMMIDGNITKEEIDLAFQMGEKMHLSAPKITDLLTEAIRCGYLPKIVVEPKNE